MKWIFFVLFYAQVSFAGDRGMFNACDSCKEWAPSKTAILLKAMDRNNVHYELWSLGSVVILSSPPYESLRCYEYFALFFGNKRSCQDFSRSFKIKCALTVTSIIDR